MRHFGRTALGYGRGSGVVIARSQCIACGWRAFGTAHGLDIAEHAHICMAELKRPVAHIAPVPDVRLARLAEAPKVIG